MNSYTIKIEVDPSDWWQPGFSEGNFVYTPALLRVEKGDQITWKCKSPFALVFKERTPVDNVELFGTKPDDDDDYSTGPHNVRDVRSQFHYAVAVFKDRVFIDADCPHVSVN
jgi:hypothetical protein